MTHLATSFFHNIQTSCFHQRPSGSRRSAGGCKLPHSSLTRRELLGSVVIGTTIVASSQQSNRAAASSSGSINASAPTFSEVSPVLSPATEVDSHGIERLKLQPQGWNTWKWRNHNINWLSAGNSGPAVVLIHGFGASVYHWRYLVPQLAKHCRVYAIDCLGFGWSDKALVDYGDYSVWTDQIADFIREVVDDDKAVLVGNSLGGYNSLATAAAHPDLVKGIVLLNAAGRFEDAGQEMVDPAEPAADAAAAAGPSSWLKGIADNVGTAIKKAVISASFIYTKQPLRIKQVLKQVYVSEQNIDDDLVESILIPANSDTAASEVFYRVITARGTPVNRLLDRFEGKMPLFLLWGSKDPWCVPARATQIEQYYPQADRVDILSGHCPHDDTPELVAPELLKWVQKLEA